MPIEVRHDPGGAVMAGAAAMGGSGARKERDGARADKTNMAAAKLRQQRDMQQADIEARANLQKQAADDAMARVAVQTGLDSQIREEEFNREVAKMQEGARLKANQWEYQFTSQQRQEIARFNNARQAIASSDRFSDEEKQAALKAIDLQQAAVKPAMLPRDPSKPVYPEGRGIGEMWRDDNGAIVSRTKDGELKLLQRFDQGPEFNKQQFQAKQQEQEQLARVKQDEAAYKLQIARESKMLDLRFKLATESVGETDAEGNVVDRMRTPEEIETILQRVMGGQQAPQQGQPAQDQPRPWYEPAEERGMTVTEADKRLPPAVGSAQAWIRQAVKTYGSPDKIPSHMQGGFREASAILRQYATLRQQAAQGGQ